MGAWADITVNTGTIADEAEGLAEEVLTDHSDGSVGMGRLAGDRLEAAKAVVRRKILASGLSQEVDRYSNWEAMLDDLADTAGVQELLWAAIAYAVLHVHTDANRTQSGGLYNDHGDDFEDDIDEAIQALENTAPFTMGWASAAGESSGGAFASTMDQYD